MLNSAFFQYYHYLFKFEVIQNTRGDLGHIEKITVECAWTLFSNPDPPLTLVDKIVLGWKNEMELIYC